MKKDHAREINRLLEAFHSNNESDYEDLIYDRSLAHLLYGLSRLCYLSTYLKERDAGTFEDLRSLVCHVSNGAVPQPYDLSVLPD